MAYDSARGVTVLFGGSFYDGSWQYYGDTWEWDGTAWTLRSSSGPSPRVNHAMAYDSARSVTVVFGGGRRDGLGAWTYNGDTWEWNGTSWTLRSESGPVARLGHRMAYDNARGVTILFGGSNENGFLGDTWEWDGTTWTMRADIGPSARVSPAMVFDSARGVTVLFGGSDGGLGYWNDTWEWDGTEWIIRPSYGGGGASPAMAYDSARAVTVRFGGGDLGPTDGLILSRYTTEWDGTSWIGRSGVGPSPRFAHAMAYDSARGVIVLFGGSGNNGRLGDTWEFDILHVTPGQPFKNAVAFSPSAPVGSAAVDDFIPSGESLTTVYVWGGYLDEKAEDPALDCTRRTVDPMPNPQDRFRVRVYVDGADDQDPSTLPGLPGALHGEAFASLAAGTVIREPFRGTTYYLLSEHVTNYAYQIDISGAGISGLVPDGPRYWIEVVNDLSGYSDCTWFWNQLLFDSSNGNRYSAVGDPENYEPGNEKPWDFSFCLDFAFEALPAPQRACCDCEGVCAVTTLANCSTEGGVWNLTREDCTGITCLALPANDDCPVFIQDVTDFGEPGAGTVAIATDTLCADTDGYNPILTEYGSVSLGNDIWFSYTPPGNCELTASMCEVGLVYDSMIALYSFGNAECPCPQDLAIHEASFIEGADDNCFVDSYGGPGFITTDAQAGVCYTIRVGGWVDSKGVGTLSVRCPIVEPPEPLRACPNPWAPDPEGGKLNRTGCFKMPASAVAAGEETTIRVKLVDLYMDSIEDPIHGCPVRTEGNDLSQFEGQVRYLGPPSAFDDNDTFVTPKFIAAELQCTPFYRDWSPAALTADFGADVDTDKIYYYGTEVFPCSVHETQQATQACVESASENCFSDPLEIRTALWGDVWTPFGGPGQPNFTDIGKVVEAFKGIPFDEGPPPSGKPRMVRAMLRGNSAPLDSTINFTDIGKDVDAFKTIAYSEVGPTACP